MLSRPSLKLRWAEGSFWGIKEKWYSPLFTFVDRWDFYCYNYEITFCRIKKPLDLFILSVLIFPSWITGCPEAKNPENLEIESVEPEDL